MELVRSSCSVTLIASALSTSCHLESVPSTLKYRPFHFSEELTKLIFLAAYI